MNCKAAQWEFDALLDGKDAVRARAHLTECPHCRNLFQELRGFHDLTKDMPIPKPPANLRGDIKQLLSR